MLETGRNAQDKIVPPKADPSPDPLDEAFEISIAGKRISGRFEFHDQESIEQLINILNVNKTMLPPKPKDDETPGTEIL